MKQGSFRIRMPYSVAMSVVVLAAVLLLIAPMGQASAAVAGFAGVSAADVHEGVIAAGDQNAVSAAAAPTIATASLKAQASSKYALLEKNGYIYPCNKKGKKLSSYWKGGSSFNHLLVAANATKIPQDFKYKYKGSSGVGMKLKSITFLLSKGKNSCKSIAAANPIGWQSGLTKIVNLQKTKITSIGKYGLTGIGVKSLTLPSTLKTIGEGAFAQCANLKTVTFPKSLKKIGKSAFQDTPRLTKLTGFSKTKVTALDDYAFAGASSLKSVTLPKTCKKLGAGVFNSCSALTTLKMPATSLVSAGNAVVGYTGIDYGVAGAAISVPASLVERYRAADNWLYYADVIGTL